MCAVVAAWCCKTRTLGDCCDMPFKLFVEKAWGCKQVNMRGYGHVIMCVMQTEADASIDPRVVYAYVVCFACFRFGVQAGGCALATVMSH